MCSNQAMLLQQQSWWILILRSLLTLPLLINTLFKKHVGFLLFIYLFLSDNIKNYFEAIDFFSRGSLWISIPFICSCLYHSILFQWEIKAYALKSADVRCWLNEYFNVPPASGRNNICNSHIPSGRRLMKFFSENMQTLCSSLPSPLPRAQSKCS